MTKKLYEVKHEYYCAETNYFATLSEEFFTEYSCWNDFIEVWGYPKKDIDLNYNLLFRFDWIEEDEDGEPNFNGDECYRNGKLKLFWMGQRKGLYQWTIIDVCRAEEPIVREWIEPFWNHLKMLWNPIS